VDISSYLKPGPNCLAFFGWRSIFMPFTFLVATVRMENGQNITVDTGHHDDWMVTATGPPQGWNLPGFAPLSDGSWRNASAIQDTAGTASVMQGGPFTNDMTWQDRVPDYRGMLQLHNPNKADLIYNASLPVNLHVSIPSGWHASNGSTLRYRIGCALANGTDQTQKTAVVETFMLSAGSRVFDVNLGIMHHGVYVIALRLYSADGTLLAERPREPFIVLKRKVMKTVTNPQNIRDGLVLELEKQIDFTDNLTAQPEWIEVLMCDGNNYAKAECTERHVEEHSVAWVNNSRVVRQDGLTYREMVGQTRSSYFSYRLGAFAHPGDFYLFE
jgi:hypothetical protein